VTAQAGHERGHGPNITGMGRALGAEDVSRQPRYGFLASATLPGPTNILRTHLECRPISGIRIGPADTPVTNEPSPERGDVAWRATTLPLHFHDPDDAAITSPDDGSIGKS
jgi:hypothetical protein